MLILIVVLGLILIVDLAVSFSLNKEVSAKVAATKEAAKPLEISLTSITDSSCKNCFDLTNTISSVKALNVKVLDEKTLDYSSLEAKQLISKYAIAKIPTLIVTGQIDKFDDPAFVKKEDGMYFVGVNPPYLDVASNKVLGLVKMTVIKDSSCKECNDINPFINQFAALGVKIVNEQDIEYTQAASVINKYGITKIPTVILSSDLEAYPTIADAWKNVGNKSSDGSFILTSINPPYRDLVKGKITGLVKVTYLSDSSCTSCYNVSVHKDILKRLGLKIVSEQTFDIADQQGKDLVSKYKITSVPTVILSPEAGDYPIVGQIWDQVGLLASDQSYVFTKLDVLGLPYKDLSTGEIKNGKSSTQA